jgi:capsular polysaccharide transport system permease protein
MIVKSIASLFRNKLLLLTTIIPTVLAIVYFGLIASDVYTSEARFVVRSPERPSTSGLGFLLKGAGFSKAQDDSYTVQDFVTSRDALQALDAELGIKKAYASADVDIFSRFAGLDWDDSLEAFHLYLQKKINVQVDTASSITTLTVKAFNADDAFKVNERLVELAEQLVNKLNERGRQDMIRFAAQEVADAENKAKAAALALAAFRSAKGVIDPEKQSQIPLQQIAKLQDELISTRAQLAQLERVARENPQVPSLRQRAALLDDEIQAEMKRVTGGERSLAGKAAEYQRLLLDREFADKMLASAMVTLEQARNDAQRKQLYLERIVQPSKPDHAMEPRRLRGVIATLAVGLVLFAVLTMLLAGMREHLD